VVDHVLKDASVDAHMNSVVAVENVRDGVNFLARVKFYIGYDDIVAQELLVGIQRGVLHYCVSLKVA
jgi:hypothetical protein